MYEEGVLKRIGNEEHERSVTFLFEFALFNWFDCVFDPFLYHSIHLNIGIFVPDLFEKNSSIAITVIFARNNSTCYIFFVKTFSCFILSWNGHGMIKYQRIMNLLIENT